MAITGVGLLVRGVAPQVILAANVAAFVDQVGQLEEHWSLILWNPWFIFGGVLSIAAAALSLSDMRVQPSPWRLHCETPHGRAPKPLTLRR